MAYLQITMTTADGSKTSNLRVQNPKQGLTSAVVKTAAQALANAGILLGKTYEVDTYDENEEWTGTETAYAPLTSVEKVKLRDISTQVVISEVHV